MSLPVNLPPHAVAALDQMQAWARERVGNWDQPQPQQQPETLHIAGYLAHDDQANITLRDRHPGEGPPAGP